MNRWAGALAVALVVLGLFAIFLVTTGRWESDVVIPVTSFFRSTAASQLGGVGQKLAHLATATATPAP